MGSHKRSPLSLLNVLLSRNLGENSGHYLLRHSSTSLAEKYQRHHTLSQSLTPTNGRGIRKIFTSSLFNCDVVNRELLNWTYY